MEKPSAKKYRSLREFYPFYLSEHQNVTSRVLHFVGTGLVIACVLAAILFHNGQLILLALLCGYGFAWVGHYFFERNRPATFKHPFYSLASDFIMFWQLLNGVIPFNPNRNS